jgi:hypothetical protein
MRASCEYFSEPSYHAHDLSINQTSILAVIPWMASSRPPSRFQKVRHRAVAVFSALTSSEKGVMDIVQSIHEGLHNAPKLYGSEVRKHGRVIDFSSGLEEAGKVIFLLMSKDSAEFTDTQGVFYGFYDGITGLYREPIEGAKKEVDSLVACLTRPIQTTCRGSWAPSKDRPEVVSVIMWSYSMRG